MNDTILFTKHPNEYTMLLKDSVTDCRIVTEEALLHAYLKSARPRLLLIEAGEPPSLSLEELIKNQSLSPGAFIYADTETLKNILLKEHPVSSFSSYDIPDDINKKLDKALIEFHFSPSLKGYHYLKQAFYYESLNSRQISQVKKDIYEAVSQCYNTSLFSVERGITFSIRKAYEKNAEHFHRIFPSSHRPPSNMQFLKTFYIYMQQSGLF